MAGSSSANGLSARTTIHGTNASSPTTTSAALRRTGQWGAGEDSMGTTCGRGRRSAVCAMTLAAVALSGTGCRGGAAATRSGPPTPSSQSSTRSTAAQDPERTFAVPPVDVLIKDELWLARGGRISLAGVDPLKVYRVPAGWLVFGAASVAAPTVSVWLLTDDGQRHLLADAEAYPLVAADGLRLAYRTGDRLVVGRIDGTSIVTVASTTAGRFGPLAFTGDRIVLGYTETGGGIDHIDLWDPAHGPFVASAAAQPMDFVGVVSAGVVARVGVGAAGESGERMMCLGLLAPDGFRTLKTACDIDAYPFYGSPISPDGHWLIATRNGTKADGNRPVVVDLSTVFDRPRVLGDWPDDRSRPIDLSTCVWPTRDTATCGAPGRVATLRMTAPGHVDWVRLDGVPTNPETSQPDNVVPVPVLGP